MEAPARASFALIQRALRAPAWCRELMVMSLLVVLCMGLSLKKLLFSRHELVSICLAAALTIVRQQDLLCITLPPFLSCLLHCILIREPVSLLDNECAQSHTGGLAHIPYIAVKGLGITAFQLCPSNLASLTQSLSGFRP